MECKCDSEDAATGWLSSGNMQMGAFTIVGYLLYRFSQTLPALIRWPIRIFCSITGLSTLWSWVTRLIGTLRVIKSLYKWLSQFWHFLVKISSKFSWLSKIIKVITGASDDDLSDLPGLRIILLRPCDSRPSSLADFLLGPTPPKSDTSPEPPLQSSRRTIILNVGEISIIDTPALPGLTLDHHSRAREGLRSLQLSSPGPHAFLIEIPILNTELHNDLNRVTQAAMELYGDEVTDYILPVITHKHSLSRRKIENLLHSQPGSYKKGPLVCRQRPEVVNISTERSVDDLNASRISLFKRVVELKKMKGSFVHELQRREDRVREEILIDMAKMLATKLGHM
ncbi:josephin-1 isoform X1 [Boleophthalmus pectinirostris]|uniref:josephin-1 isoform X1 n=1 Tax=Boleophthalmus pectinirostris TaxID=150288 RepID=UPI000A1C2D3E|nr:josephin-1 isoform X1 [Boleophthalmus pectinirostris]XP_020779978.1 josephin-1 isoform X1 [Boleophthalmus pectinirostris]